MRRTAMATGLALVSGIAINYATQFGPAWTRNPWVVWPVVAVLVVLTVVAAVAERRGDSPSVRPVPAGVVRLDSLRPPSLDVRVRGRDAELARLADLVRRPRGRFAVICGPGGSGKTTVAAELAQRARQSGIVVWWVRFRDPESFTAQLVEIAESLGAPTEFGRSLPDVVWSTLAAQSRWLLVVDNVDRPQALSPTGEPLADRRGWVRDGGGGLLLITSRDADPHTWGRGAELITLDTLSTVDAARVLLDLAPQAGTRAQAEELAARLGGFPLALHAAGRALAQPTARHRTFDAYRAALDTELSDTLAAPHTGPLTEDQERTLLRYTWELSLDQLVDEGHPAARPLLRMLSLAADAPLPRDLITPELFGGDIAQSSLDSGLAGLHRYGLVGVRAQSVPCVTLYPLVRQISVLQLADAAGAGSWQSTLDGILLADAERAASCGRAGWDRASILAPHLIPILARLDGARDTLERVAHALRKAGNAAAELPLRRAILAVTQTISGPDHPATLSNRNNLAEAARDLGDLSQAAALHARNLADRERLLGPDHTSTLISRNNLAITLRGLGEVRRALELHELNVAAFERVLGTDHPHTLVGRDNLARALLASGDVGRAVELHERALSDCERVLGRDHPSTSHCRNNLAAALSELGEVARAAELHEQALADRERVLGPDHPDTLVSRHNLAATLSELGDVTRAVDLLERTLADRERVLGADHPDTQRSRDRLAAALEGERRGQWWRVWRKRRQ